MPKTKKHRKPITVHPMQRTDLTAYAVKLAGGIGQMRKVITELTEALECVRVWNNNDIRGFEDISPNLGQLKARRQVIATALKKARGR